MFVEFNSISFFIDLVAVTVVLAPLLAFVKNKTGQHILLTVSGFWLLFSIAPRLALFFTIFWTIVIAAQNLLALSVQKNVLSRGLFTLFLCLLLAPMVIWKIWEEPFSVKFNLWGNDIIHVLSYDLWTVDLASQIIIPIGLSFAVFRAVDLLIKTYLELIPRLQISEIFAYGFFPAVQVSGPIIEYEEIETRRDPSAPDIAEGVKRILFGFIKVLILAAALKNSALIFSEHEEQPVYLIWFLLIAYSWFFYLNFSGYSDLAIGVSRLLGYKLKENFDFPYFKPNISEFWAHWHMSLTRFAQRNVFVPLGGFRPRTQYLAICATIMVIALWHDLSPGMIIFGVYHAAGLCAHRYASQHGLMQNIPAALKILMTYTFVLLSFPLLAAPLEQAAGFYLSMIGGPF